MKTSEHRRIPRLVAVATAGALAVVGLVAPSAAVADGRTVSTSWLDSYFNNTAVGDPGSDYADFDFLPSPSYIVRGSGGIPADTEQTLGDTGLTYSISGGVAGAPDNISASGQTIDASHALGAGASQPATQIAFVGAATSGSKTVDITLDFSDGSTQDLQGVVLSDWCDSTPQGTNTQLTPWSQRWYNGSIQQLACGLWSTEVYTLTPTDSSATLSSITLPDQPDFHVFAIASDAVADPATSSVQGSGAVTITPSAAQYDGSDITVQVTDSTVAWSVPGVSDQYGWLVDGQPVLGADGTTYTVQASDVGKPIQAVVSGSLPGYAPGQVVSDPVTIQPGQITADGSDTPTISGTAQVGKTLTATPGSFDPSDVALDYAWYADGSAIAGATTQTLDLRADQLGKKITVTVTASKEGFTDAQVTSDPTAAVAEGVFQQMSATTVDGRYAAGSTLDATIGTYDAPGVSVHLQWTADGAAIDGATSTTLPLTADLVGKTIALDVTATKAGYADVTDHVNGFVVAPGDIAVLATPGVTGSAVFGSTLTIVPGSYDPSDVTEAYQWFADGKPVAGATGATYSPTAAQVGATLQVRVTASLDGFSNLVTTVPSGTVAAASMLLTKVPTVSKARVGKKATVTSGSYSQPGASVTYQWLVAGNVVSGKKGTKATYKPKAKDKGKQLSVRVTATKPGFTTVTSTTATTKVKKGKISLKKKAKIKAAKKHAKVGKKLKVTKGKYKPKKVKVTYRWFSGHKKIKGKKGKKRTYTVRKADAGKKIRVKVTVKKKGYKKHSYKTKKTPKVKG